MSQTRRALFFTFQNPSIAAAILAIGIALLAIPNLPAAETTPATTKKADFESEILPIFKRNCLACHDGIDAEADLVLETPKTILKGGENGPVVVPHHSEKSSLLKNAAKESKPFMPPKNNKVGAEALKPEELALLKAWIDQGAIGTVNAKPKPVEWRPLPPGLHPILAVTVTPDGQFAACGRANQIFVYHVPTGQLVARLVDPKLTDKPNRSGYQSSAQRDFVQSLAFSPDGRTLASGEYRMVKLWQREPNAPQFNLGNDPATAVATSADGKWLATAGKDNVIRIWDSSNGKPVKELLGHSAAINSLAFSPDNAKLASGSVDKSVRVFDIISGKEFSHADTMTEISAVTWVLGGKQLATGGGDNVIRLWELPAQTDGVLKPLKDLTGHTQPVTSLAASADGKQLVSGSRDGSIRHWAVEQNKQARQMDHGAPVTAVAITPNGKTFASTGGNVAKLWSAERGQMTGEIKGDHVARAKIGQSERASVFAKSEVAYWKTTLETAMKAKTVKADALKKATDAIAPAEKAVNEKRDALAKVTDDKARAAEEDALKKATTTKTSVDKILKDVQLSSKLADQALADAKAASEKAAVTQQKTDDDLAAAKKALPASESPIRALAISTDGLIIATAGDDQIIRTWSVENGVGFDTFANQSGPVQVLAFTSDGRIIASTKDKAPLVWRTKPTWTLTRSIGNSSDLNSPLVNRVLALDFSPDGQLLATGGGVPSRSGELKIWRVSDGSLVREVKPSHSDTIFSLAFSPDGRAIASASGDKFVKIFNPDSGKLIKSLSGHTHYALGVSWRADGRALASCGADKAVKLWSLPGGEQTKSIEDFKKEVTSVRYVGDQILTASGEARMRLLKEDGGNVKDFSGSKGFIFTTAATTDEQTILSGGQDSVLRIWNTTTGKSLFNLDPPPAESASNNVGQTVVK